MIVHPSIERVLYGKRGIVAGIESCVNAMCVMSALTLIYSAIDAIAGLARDLDKKENDGGDFKAWVGLYYLPSLTASITSQDLWAARCGIVHAYSPHSGLSHSGDVRILIYRWRHAHRPDDPILANYEKQANATVLEIESLVEAFNRATELFSQRIETDADLKRRVDHHVKALLCYEPWTPVPIVVSP
jgi:hypothetical protein